MNRPLKDNLYFAAFCLIAGFAFFWLVLSNLGCSGPQLATADAALKIVDASAFAAVQTQINSMPAGSTGRANEQAWLNSVQTYAELVQVAADVATAVASGPTTIPVK